MNHNNENAEIGFGTVLFLIAICLVGIVLIFGFFTTAVPAGNVGIQDTFGSVSDQVLPPGFHLKGPFTGVAMMSTRTTKYIDYGSGDKATITALSHDGLTTTMGIAVNYHINPGKAVDLYKNVGTDYMNVVMVNPIHSVPRDLISKYDTKTLYSASLEGSTDRAKLEQELYSGISERLNAIGVRDSIVIEQVSIRDIDFPQVYKDAITSKMKMDTEIQQKQLEVQRQKMEAERVVAEAEGEANANVARAKGEAEANRIRTASLSNILLQYTWIQTMKDNPKAIYIPVGENGLPIFKNVDGSA
jgi:regulator of protease activity HflC (stomatin/prohibitin superfamily)